MKSNAQGRGAKPVEPFSMLPKRVTAADTEVLSQNAKLIYAVLVGMPGARDGRTVWLTQQQIAESCGCSVRTVGDAVRMLEAVGLVSLTAHTSYNGFKVYGYLVHEAAESSLPPAPRLTKSLSPHLREVFERHRSQDADFADCDPQTMPLLAATDSDQQSANDRSADSNFRRQEEELQEEFKKYAQEELQEGSVPFMFVDSDEGALLLVHPTAQGFAADIEALSMAMEKFLGDDVGRSNSFVQDLWTSTAPVAENLSLLLMAAQLGSPS